MTPEHQAKLVAASRAVTMRPIEERFEEKVDRSGGPDACHPWIGALKPDGYGLIWMGNRTVRVHRVAWLLAGKELPAHPMVLDHTCRNRGCCNVRHLRAVDPRTNCIENNAGPWARNAAATECPHGHPYSPENTALTTMKFRKNKYGNLKPVKHPGRICLTCYPDKWRSAVIPREPPPPGASAAAARVRAERFAARKRGS